MKRRFSVLVLSVLLCLSFITPVFAAATAVNNRPADKVIAEADYVAKLAKSQKWVYGFSTSKIPCNDKKTSADRFVSRVLWQLGLRDQRKGGETISTLVSYLRKYKKRGVISESNTFSSIKKGSIVFVKHKNKNTWSHCFIVKSYNGKNHMTVYDFGSASGIRAGKARAAKWNWKNTVLVFNPKQLNLNLSF